MKVLVSGGSGFVGYRLCEKFVREGHEVEYTYFSHGCEVENARGHKVDITDAGAVFGIGNKYDVIVHCAALANVDYCQNNPQVAHRHNVEGSANFAALAKKTGAKLVYVSTAHVFPASGRAYSEGDEPLLENATSVYGKTKLEGEMLVRSAAIPFLILRIDQPYYWNMEWQKENTVTRTFRKLGAGEPVREVEDWMNCPTFVPSFCNLAHALIKMDARGVFNAAGPDYVSRLEWGRAVARTFGYKENAIEPISSSSLKLPVERPNVQLDSSRAYALAKIENVSIEKGLQIMKQERGGASA